MLSTASGSASALRCGSSRTPNQLSLAQTSRRTTGEVLADAAGEGDRVDTVERGDHPGDLAGQPVHVGVERELGRESPLSRARDHLPHVARGLAQAEQARTGVRARRRARPPVRPPWVSSHEQQAGVDRPGPGRHHQAVDRREAHAGVDRPAAARPRTAEAPAPRWQLTSRRSLRADSSAVRRAAYRWDRPWKPYRRSPQRLRHSAGSAYVAAAGGSVRWNAVSKQAMAGASGNDRPTCAGSASAPAAGAAVPAGPAPPACAPPRRRPCTGPPNSSPPCTTRCTTASTAACSTSSSSAFGVAGPVGRRPARPRSLVVVVQHPFSLRLDEPALTTSSRTSALPAPVADLGQVLAVLG